MNNLANTITLRSRPTRDTDRWLRDFLGPATVEWFKPAPHTASDFTPAAEVTKDGNDAVIRLQLPGVDVDQDVNVDVERGRLVIHGERRDENAEHTGDAPDAANPENKVSHILREFRYGSFRRAFQLPAHVSSEAITASYHAGVLTVRVVGAYTGAPAQRITITH